MATSTPTKVGFASAPFFVIAALVVALQSDKSEGRRYTPYLDSIGRPTVCAGITGPAVMWGRKYTEAECDVLEIRYAEQMLAKMGGCVPGDRFEFREVVVWGEFAYNVGSDGFCKSTAAELLRQGRNKEACAQMTNWRFVTLNGKKFDCSTPGNKVCPGLWTRRQRERATCEG